MRICHLCLNGPYNEGWNYQENILPKYHVKLGYEVFQIVTPYYWKGTELAYSEDTRYINESGVNIIRLKPRKGIIGGIRFNRYPEVSKCLDEINPNILFIHDVQCLDMSVVADYLRIHEDCIAYADNHSDFSNSAQNWLSKNILHKVIWKRTAHIVNPYIKTFFGVLPARVDFLVDVYGIPKEKCKLLVMGADDEFVEAANTEESVEKKRNELGIAKEDFLIVTGGKIDAAKRQTVLLMKAVRNIPDSKIKLVIFGAIEPNIKAEFEDLLLENKVMFVGWVQPSNVYSFFGAADLVIFPGRHSVFWEQVVAMGKPMIVKYWDGTDHVNRGGNVEFLYEDSDKEIEEKIKDCCQTKKYAQMREIAQKASSEFLYSRIAKNSIGVE